MYVCLLRRFNCSEFSATALGATANAALRFHTANTVYEQSKPPAKSFGFLKNVGFLKTRPQGGGGGGGEKLPGWTTGAQRSERADSTAQQSSLRFSFREKTPPPPLRTASANIKQQRLQAQQDRQLAKMKERVSIVLQRSEKKRSQNARAAASRSSPSSSDKQERAPRDSEIKAPMVNLVLEDGSIDGIHPLTRVLGTMDRSLFTLVMVDPSQDPPVCRIFSRKILYERERQSRKQQNVAVKNAKPQRMVMACAIGDHDLEIKMRKTMDLLAKGRRVTVVIEHKGRQMPDRRKELGAKVMAELQEKFSVVSPPAMEGRMWSVMFQGKP